MYVDIDLAQVPPRPRLVEPDDFTSFQLTSRGPRDPGALDRALGDLGRVDDDHAHAWLALDGLRALAGERAGTPAWSESFDGMVRYADSKGWLTPAGDAIRAHIEHLQPGSKGA
jgi:hypothetical protein